MAGANRPINENDVAGLRHFEHIGVGESVGSIVFNELVDQNKRYEVNRARIVKERERAEKERDESEDAKKTLEDSNKTLEDEKQVLEGTITLLLEEIANLKKTAHETNLNNNIIHRGKRIKTNRKNAI